MSSSVVALVVLLSAFAVAAPEIGASDVDLSIEEHCVVFVVDQTPEGELITSEPVCFASEEIATGFADLGLAATTDLGGAVVASTTFTLGTHYDGFNGTGSSITVVGSNCAGGYWNTSSSWDNRISSSYNGCYRLKHWDYPNKSGPVESTVGIGQTDNLGFMNNKTESVSYHSS